MTSKGQLEKQNRKLKRRLGKGQKRSWNRQYRDGRTKAQRTSRKRVVEAMMTGTGLVESESGDGFVYVMSIGIDNLYKIGCTTNVSKRLKSLMSSNPKLSLSWVARVMSRRDSEIALHTRFARFRRVGELFELHEPQLAELDDIFPNSAPMDIESLLVPTIARPRLDPGEVRCVNCGSPFRPGKSYWRRCPTCIKGSNNRTAGGWQRWRNLRTQTHLYEDRPK
jgi:hypothetical protein